MWEFTCNRLVLRVLAYSHQGWKQMFRNTDASTTYRGMWRTSRSHRRKISHGGVLQEQPLRIPASGSFPTELLFRGWDAPNAPSVLIWFSRREMHHPGTKRAHIVFPFLSDNFPQMDNEHTDYLAVSAPAWCGRLTSAFQQVIIGYICSSKIIC